jgi:DNA-directed RNA polymerase III subunit RPC4
LSFKREGGAGGGNSRGPGGASGGFNVKREGGGGSYSGSGLPGTQDRDWFPEPQYPHDDDDVAKIDIEAINLISDEDDEPQYSGSRSKSNVYGKGSSKKGLRPVRLHREEHKERVLLVNTESSTKSPPDEDGNLPTNDDLQPSKNAKEFKGVYQDPDDVQIKDEPRATPEPPELTVKASPDSKRKIQDAHASTVPINLDPVLDEETFTSPREKRKVRRPSKNKEKKPVIQTEEDRAEYMRHLDDIEILAKELGGMQGNINKGKAKDTEGDTAMDNTTAEDEEQKHGNGRLYLFQFPPVLPELYNPAKDLKPRNPMLVRREEEDAAAKAKEELELLGSMSTTGSNSKGKLSSRPDLTGEPAPTAPVAIKKEEEGVETAAEKARREEEERKKKNKKADVVHEEGWVGKLIVRESGRVELTWGGTTLLVGRGAEASFLTTGVIVDSVERGPPGGGVAEGKAMGMGQIMGKFVVTPDWENY